MRIAMIGQRGVPATYGGVERHVEELGSRLAARGHELIVYCRSNYAEVGPTHYRGMRLIHLPTVGTKHLDALLHSGLATLDALRRRVDIVHYHALGPGVWSPLPRLLGHARVVQTVHGLDHVRAKWSLPARTLLGGAAWMSGHVPHDTIAVSRALAAHYSERYGRPAAYIPNGVDVARRQPPHTITERYHLTSGSYVLFVGRLVPEKAPHLLIEAFRGVAGETRLVIVGGSSFTDEYHNRLERLAAQDRRIILPGYVYGETLAELYTSAAAFVLPSSVEGLPLTLLEALSYGTPVIASDIAPHVEVLREDSAGARLFESGSATSLTEVLRGVLDNPAVERQGAAQRRERVIAEYDWDTVADLTGAVYRGDRLPRG